MSFLGKDYRLEKQENFEEFLKSLGREVTEDYTKKLLTSKPINKVVKSGDTYTLISSSGETQFKDGVEFDEQVNDRPAKTIITVSGNTVTQVQKFDNGVSLTIKREFSDNELVATITNSIWSGEARRYYKA